MFRGIPYASAPLGRLRFAAPQPPAPWSGVRDALAPGPIAMQRGDVFQDLLAYRWEAMSEDCLYLDVFAPTDRSSDPRPVMVWIPGGAFSSGAGSMPIYDGATLARQGDVVVVTLNYRVGVFGFFRGRNLPSDEVDSSGNQGLLDIVAALQWVRDEIDGFGGDPGCVTIFGESAGGVAVSTLLGMPGAHGLFQRAIVQSGNAALLNPVGAAEEFAGRFLSALGLAWSDASALYERTGTELLDAQAMAVAAQQRDAPTTLPFSPVVDGEVLPAHPLGVRPPLGVAVMGGTTRDEYRLFHIVDPAIDTLARERLLRRVQKRISGSHPDGTAERVVEAYAHARTARGEGVAPGDLWAAIETDRQMFVPIQEMLGAYAAEGVPAYAYTFTWRSPYQDGRLGSCHTLDVPFIFATHSQAAIDKFAGTGPAADAMATTMQHVWTTFARKGRPSLPDGTPWPEFTAAGRETMMLGVQSRTESNPFDVEYRIWRELRRSVEPHVLC